MFADALSGSGSFATCSGMTIHPFFKSFEMLRRSLILRSQAFCSKCRPTTSLTVRVHCGSFCLSGSSLNYSDTLYCSHALVQKVIELLRNPQELPPSLHEKISTEDTLPGKHL